MGFSEAAEAKIKHLIQDPVGFFVLSLMAGAYVGLGILLIFSVGQGVDASVRPIVMGASFGLALLLVVFAGSELFTGHTMYMTHGLLTGKTSVSDLVQCWLVTWIGNLFGAALLAAIFVYGGGGLILASSDGSVLHTVAEKKMNTDGFSLILKGILCNWLVCLAIWTSSRAASDGAKAILIWFCLYAFIASGFEHSVANMTIFGVALLSEHGNGISIGGALHNLFFVSIGNAIAGSIIMGLGYWVVAGRPSVRSRVRTH
jgi:nitrite transporter NirC